MKGHVILGAALAAAWLPVIASADDYDLDTLRAATEKYKDVNVALAEGFIQDPSGHCVSAAAEGLPAEWGAMGIHYLRPDLLEIAQGGERVDGGSTYTDFMAPAILIYEPQEDGTLELVGIENLVFEKAWTEAGNSAGPMFNGRMWDHMADDAGTDADEAHGFMPHYDKHVWLFRENPNGVDVPFNPNVTCEHQHG
ncbi:hypothetical protein [Defluviimonas sp. WL0075]|uniref:Uncharacterized protein n=1 Tax=Albidovulum sediminicola TaxID=2984331 RepID=A0ABT2YX56_9RHOB|nr:hypothetical protein [Defluviimonas sp. WL0075]MCV2863410.1 hypothetical protein [Defluviimonas sp. WL0075]